MKKSLKVVVLDVDPDRARTLFYTGGADDDEAPPTVPNASGPRAWAEAKLHALKESWRHAEGRAARWCRAVWHWLHRFTHPDETLLARLRLAREIELHHPERMSAEEVQAAWRSFLAASRRRHWPWFVANLLIAPLSVVLAVLPGPNVIGYWFAYRALHHGLILHGLRQVRKRRVETVLHSTGRLDREAGSEAERLAALGHDSEAVGAFLRRHGVKPERPAA